MENIVSWALLLLLLAGAGTVFSWIIEFIAWLFKFVHRRLGGTPAPVEQSVVPITNFMDTSDDGRKIVIEVTLQLSADAVPALTTIANSYRLSLGSFACICLRRLIERASKSGQLFEPHKHIRGLDASGGQPLGYN